MSDDGERVIKHLRSWLGREPTAEELAALGQAKSSPGLNRAVCDLAFKALADNIRLHDENRVLRAQAVLDGLDGAPRPAEHKTTVKLQVNFGSTADIINAVESGARRYGVTCQTRVVKTGVFSKRLYFDLTAPDCALEDFLRHLRDWGVKNGFGWLDV